MSSSALPPASPAAAPISRDDARYLGSEFAAMRARTKALLDEQLEAEARVIAEGCPHPDAKVVDSHGNWPSDTITLRYRCWTCGVSWEREFLPTDPEVNRPDARRVQLVRES